MIVLKIVGIIIALILGLFSFAFIASFVLDQITDKEIGSLDDKVKKAREKLSTIIPIEIREVVDSIDISKIISEFGQILSLSNDHILSLKEKLIPFFSNDVWSKTNMIYLDRDKNINNEIFNKIIRLIIERLDIHGLNDKNIIFEKNNKKFTAYNAYIGKYTKYETHRIILTRIVKMQKIFSKRIYYEIYLEADYSERGRWGEYEHFSLKVDTEEEVDVFIDSLNKAVKVGNFISFADQFRRFEL